MLCRKFEPIPIRNFEVTTNYTLTCIPFSPLGPKGPSGP